MITKLRAATRIDGGPANHWLTGTGENGKEYFLKLPRADIRSAHPGPWKEYVVARLARDAGIDTLIPEVIEVTPNALSGANVSAAEVFWPDANLFSATAWQPNLTRCQYQALGQEICCVLYFFDLWMWNGDRALPDARRADCWKTGDRVIVTDWEGAQLPERDGQPLQTGAFLWHVGAFLVHERGFRAAKRAVQIIAAIGDTTIRSVTNEAAGYWASIDPERLAAWLKDRRDALMPAFEAESLRENAAPPWWTPGNP